MATTKKATIDDYKDRFSSPIGGKFIPPKKAKKTNEKTKAKKK